MTRATPLTAFRIAHPPVVADRVNLNRAAFPRPADLAREVAPDLSVNIYTDLAAVESEWRSFQQTAECTAFQTFEWLSAWQCHIGAGDRVLPIIAVGRFANGETAFIAPLALEQRRGAKRLRWLGQDLCDYNAPLLARDFSQRVTSERFLAIWQELRRQLQSDPRLRHDWIEFEKMPQTIGVQVNPFIALGVVPNANSAHITLLGDNWETFYRAKRSSATRRHDRSKRKHMAEFGEVLFSTVTEPDDVQRTLKTLWQQKKQIFARKGIADIFDRRGYREFFADMASNPSTQHLAHVSRIDIGDTCAAANFALTFGGCYYHVLASYCDGQLTRFGPGALHLRELLAHAIGAGLRLFDFTIGDEHYKLEWSDQCLKLYDYSAAATWRGLPESFASFARRRLKRFIKQSPLAWRFACRVRSVVRPF